MGFNPKLFFLVAGFNYFSSFDPENICYKLANY